MTKIIRKVSVVVILAIMVAAVFGIGGIFKYQETLKNDSNNNDFFYQNMKNSFQQDFDNNKTLLADLKKKKTSAKAEELFAIDAQIRNAQNQVDMFEYAKTQKVILYSKSYRAQDIYKLFGYKMTLNELKVMNDSMLSNDQKATKKNAEKYIPRLEKAIEKNDFKEHIAIINDELKENDSLSKEEKEISYDSNKLRLKLNITGEKNGEGLQNDKMNDTIYLIEREKTSLLFNLDYTSSQKKPLTLQMREKLKDDIAVNEYKLVNGLISNDNNIAGINIKEFAISNLLAVGLIMVLLLMIVLAGGSVSQEISTGSIKSLIIAPVKRWKIFTAKVLSLLAVGICSTILVYLVSILANGIYFGFDSGVPYIYAVNGVAHELNFYVYQLSKLFIDFIDVIIYTTLAFMLSVVSRNTALAVGISIGTYFAGSIANTVLLQFFRGEWLKFIPFNNFGISIKVFPTDSVSQLANNAMSNMNAGATTTLAFSVCYIIVLILLMGYIALDSFKRRDIR